MPSSTVTRLPQTSGLRYAVVGALAATYGVFLAFVVFWPTPIDRPVASLLARVISELHERGVPAFIDYGFIEFSANILLFVPVGFVIGLLLPMRWSALALVLGPLLSAGIEFAQRVVLDERYATVADVVANSIGATIGVVVALVIRALVGVRDAQVIERYEAVRRMSRA